jgi:CheY-like chemotaxis protein
MKRILIVDDNKIIYQLLRHLLVEYSGGKKVKINYARNGSDAIELLKWDDTDVIFLDIIMPRMSGIEFMQKLRRLKEKMPVVVVMTGFRSLECEDEVMKLGAVACVHKPFKTVELQNIAEKYLAN